MYYTKNLLRIKSLDDLRKYRKLFQSMLNTMHLFIECDFDDISGEIEEICRQSLAYSIILKTKSQKAIKIASDCNTIPFFIRKNKKDVINLICNLKQNPFKTLSKAINSYSVIYHYLEGCPT